MFVFSTRIDLLVCSDKPSNGHWPVGYKYYLSGGEVDACCWLLGHFNTHRLVGAYRRIVADGGVQAGKQRRRRESFREGCCAGGGWQWGQHHPRGWMLLASVRNRNTGPGVGINHFCWMYWWMVCQINLEFVLYFIELRFGDGVGRGWFGWGPRIDLLFGCVPPDPR